MKEVRKRKGNLARLKMVKCFLLFSFYRPNISAECFILKNTRIASFPFVPYRMQTGNNVFIYVDSIRRFEAVNGSDNCNHSHDFSKISCFLILSKAPLSAFYIRKIKLFNLSSSCCFFWEFIISSVKKKLFE